MLESAVYTYDFEAAQLVLAMTGAMLCVYVMSLTSYEHEDRADPTWLRWCRRFGHALTAIALFWSLSFMGIHRWMPSPPILLLIVAVNISMLVRATAIHLRIRREGRRRGAVTHQQARSTLRWPY